MTTPRTRTTVIVLRLHRRNPVEQHPADPDRDHRGEHQHATGVTLQEGQDVMGRNEQEQAEEAEGMIAITVAVTRLVAVTARRRRRCCCRSRTVSATVSKTPASEPPT